jgi:hypothetical protein
MQEGQLLPGNPFVVESPEKLSPEQLVGLFIEKYTQIETVRQRRHTFIWGSRGSGKSMLLRYLEPQCQAIVHGGTEKVFGMPEPFLGVYCPCKEGQLNKTEFETLDESAAAVVSEHLLNLTIADRLVSCLREQFRGGKLPLEDLVSFATNVAMLFDPASIASSTRGATETTDETTDPLEWLHRLFALENLKIGTFLRRCCLSGGESQYEGATSGYHDFLLPLMRLTSELQALKEASVYVLLDDADRLNRVQQSIVNTWIANRDNRVLCVKVSAQRERYETLLTLRGGMIEQPHDYSEVDVEELYTQSKSDYAKKVRLIAERRLELSPIPQKNIDLFFPANETERMRFEEIKKETAAEWEREGEPGREGDFVNRYATARLFQELRRKKQRKSYAGFQNLVHLSSGVVRDFLEPCYLMVDACIRKGAMITELQSVAPSVQDEVCYKYSEEFLDVKLQDIRKDLPPENWSQLDALRTMIESLGRLFYERLHDPSAREARLFSFTVRGSLSDDLTQILQLGVRHRYFQRRTYSTKEGGGREPWYILNRRLCPVFKLDPTGFEGRISLSSEDIRIACEDPTRFVRVRSVTTEDNHQRLLFECEPAEGQKWIR